jgi:hypothetical protein
MSSIRPVLLGAGFLFAVFVGALVNAATPAAPATAPPKAPPAGKAATGNEPPPPWPRTFTEQGTQVVLHQPQLDSWESNKLIARMAVAVKTGQQKGDDGKMHDTYDWGAIEVSARTDVDKINRKVTLSETNLQKVTFPADKDKEAHYTELLRAIIAQRGVRVVSLDNLEAAMAIKQETAGSSVKIKNDPPDIVFSFEPALLVLIDGAPVLKPSGVAGIERIINTRALELKQGDEYYLVIAGTWLISGSPIGEWRKAASVSPALQQAKAAAEKAKVADTLDEPSPDLKKILDSGKIPKIVVATKPTEMILVDGEPQFTDIADTQLAYVENTPADVFIDKSQDNVWYVLVSGRWFTAATSNGPWHYVEGKSLPADFAKIPSDSEKSAVLASIPGTPEARESLIANSIPQTASVNRKTAKLEVTYDGAPKFKPIEETSLSYAWNTQTPVIKVSDNSYFAVKDGVWFMSAHPFGPWQVADKVPSEIYSIPASSPLHYVTYVKVYSSDSNDVYVGFTPGYYGTVVNNDVVVYGTGYECDPWIGDFWYGCPETYGSYVSFGYDPWYGWGFGYYWGWWWAAAWYGPWYGYGWGWGGYWGGAFAVANVYGRWGNAVVGGVAAGWANPWTGNYGRAGRGGYYNTATGGRGYGYAYRNTNIYTGTTRAGAGGVRYNPETGRAVATQVGGAYNAYTGNAAVGGKRTTVNTDTGRVTQSAGGAVRTDSGTTAGKAFSSSGEAGDIKGAGFVHKDSGTGEITTGGAIKAGDNVYAGKDGNIYKYTPGEGWQPVKSGDAEPKGGDRGGDRGGGAGVSNDSIRNAGVDSDRMARERGADRSAQRSSGSNSSYNRSNYNSNYRGSMGGSRMGGGRSFGGGGGRRR